MASRPSRPTPVALTVAGSDSGGGAGIQTDLKVFHALGVFGTSAVTAITAQNPTGISAIQPVRPAVVAAQLDRVFAAFRVGAAKTGMLHNAATIRVVAESFRRRRFRRLVVDPVMVATSGAHLLRPDALAALRRELLPLAALVTPNLTEAEVLTGRPIRSRGDLRDAACRLHQTYGVPFLVKGGHLACGNRAIDALADDHGVTEFVARRLDRIRPHGAGCAFSAAITAYLALGHDLRSAITGAKRLIARGLARPLRLGRYRALRL